MTEDTQIQKEKELAEYLSKLADMSRETRTALAEKIGFRRPNILSMVLLGKTRLPLDKIHPFARAVGADPNHLARLCLETYEPVTWKLVQQMYAGKDVVSPAEWEVIRAIREATENSDPVVTPAQLTKIKKLFA
jgi:hypothetical protein